MLFSWLAICILIDRVLNLTESQSLNTFCGFWNSNYLLLPYTHFLDFPTRLDVVHILVSFLKFKLKFKALLKHINVFPIVFVEFFTWLLSIPSWLLSEEKVEEAHVLFVYGGLADQAWRWCQHNVNRRNSTGTTCVHTYIHYLAYGCFIREFVHTHVHAWIYHYYTLLT